jgi:hypothetical protein
MPYRVDVSTHDRVVEVSIDIAAAVAEHQQGAVGLTADAALTQASPGLLLAAMTEVQRGMPTAQQCRELGLVADFKVAEVRRDDARIYVKVRGTVRGDLDRLDGRKEAQKTGLVLVGRRQQDGAEGVLPVADEVVVGRDDEAAQAGGDGALVHRRRTRRRDESDEARLAARPGRVQGMSLTPAGRVLLRRLLNGPLTSEELFPKEKRRVDPRLRGVASQPPGAQRRNTLLALQRLVRHGLAREEVASYAITDAGRAALEEQP